LDSWKQGAPLGAAAAAPKLRQNPYILAVFAAALPDGATGFTALQEAQEKDRNGTSRINP
jgi:hypothetical protein